MDEKNDGKTNDRPWLFQEGNPGGPGRPLGKRDWNTDFDAAVKEIAKEEGKTESEVRVSLLKKAYHQAKNGQYSFFDHIANREYGKVGEKLDIESTNKISYEDSPLVKEMADKLRKLDDKANHS